MRYWVNTVSLDHVMAGVVGGFTQANHGKATSLVRLTAGDQITFYSPRTAFGGEPLQCFTAIGRVVDDEPYQVEMTGDFHPWRRRMAFLPCKQAPVRNLVDELGFITNKRRWGMAFRRGLFEISARDFHLIARAMQAEL